MVMNSKRVIIDSGALVAMLNKRDQYHKWVRSRIYSLKSPYYTCESVLSEAWFLLREERVLQEKLLRLFKDSHVKIDLDIRAELPVICDLITRYNNVPMSVADACLVRMSELHNDSVVFTTDSDFKIYRRFGNKTIPAILPT